MRFSAHPGPFGGELVKITAKMNWITFSELGRIASQQSRGHPPFFQKSTALLSKETKISPPSHSPSKAMTPSAKSPPASRISNPASAAGRFTSILAAFSSARIVLAISGAGSYSLAIKPKPVRREPGPSARLPPRSPAPLGRRRFAARRLPRLRGQAHWHRP